MYKKGDVKVSSKDEYLVDTRTDEYDNVPLFSAYLEHSCDDWIIGGPEQIKQLILDLLGLYQILTEEKLNERGY